MNDDIAPHIIEIDHAGSPAILVVSADGSARLLPAVSGGQEDGSEAGSDGEGDPGSNGASGDGEKKFTQAELDEIVKVRLEKQAGANSTKVAEALGMSVEDAKKVIDKAEEARKAGLSELEREREARVAAEAAVAQARAESVAKERLSRVELELVKAGVSAERVAQIAPLVGDGEPADAVAVTKSTFPELFTTKPGSYNPTPPPGGGGDGGGSGVKSVADRMAALRKEREASNPRRQSSAA